MKNFQDKVNFICSLCNIFITERYKVKNYLLSSHIKMMSEHQDIKDKCYFILYL